MEKSLPAGAHSINGLPLTASVNRSAFIKIIETASVSVAPCFKAVKYSGITGSGDGIIEPWYGERETNEGGRT